MVEPGMYMTTWLRNAIEQQDFDTQGFLNETRLSRGGAELSFRVFQVRVHEESSFSYKRADCGDGFC